MSNEDQVISETLLCRVSHPPVILYIHVPAGSSLLRSRDVYLSVDSLTEPYSYAVGLPFPIRLRRFPHLSLLSSTNRCCCCCCCCCCCVVAISGVQVQQCDILELQSPVVWLASIPCLSRECMSVRRVGSSPTSPNHGLG